MKNEDKTYRLNCELVLSEYREIIGHLNGLKIVAGGRCSVHLLSEVSYRQGFLCSQVDKFSDRIGSEFYQEFCHPEINRLNEEISEMVDSMVSSLADFPLWEDGAPFKQAEKCKSIVLLKLKREQSLKKFIVAIAQCTDGALMMANLETGKDIHPRDVSGHFTLEELKK